MQCFQCGKILEDDLETCPHCGTKLDITDQSTMLVSPDFQKDSPTLVTGDILNQRFKIIRTLGQGGMGQIFLAEDIRLKRKVAIKSINAAKSDDPSTRARFLREAQVVSQLEHSNICSIYEFFEVEGNSYFVMQYIDGVTLNQLTQDNSLSLGKVLEVAIQICDAILEAHQNGIVHRDLKPSNIMIDRKGKVVVLDFGLAKFRPNQAASQTPTMGINPTEQGMVLGTVPYMSPEQARGETLDFRSDIFSFGTILFECLEGRHPFAGKEQIETLYNIIKGDPVYSDDLPIPLKQFLKKLLAKDPDQRFSSFEPVRESLQALQQQKDLLLGLTPAESNSKSLGHKHRTESLDLSQMVRGLKSTAATISKPSPTRFFNKKVFWTIPLMLIAGLMLLFVKPFFVTDVPTQRLVLLDHFQDLTEKKDVAGPLFRLFAKGLNQFDEFKTITRKDLGLPESTDLNAFIEQANKRFKISFVLTGKIIQNNSISIDALLTSTDQTERWNIPMTGPDKDSLLSRQVDFIVEEVFKKLTGTDPVTLYKTEDLFGKSWEDMQTLDEGISNFEMLKTMDSEILLNKVKQIPMARYYLAQIDHFCAHDDKGLHQLQSILPELELFSPEMKARILALKARTEFNFEEQKKQLNELKRILPFSKEVLFEVGEAYFHMGQAKQAQEHYLQALKIDPTFSKAINHLGYTYSYLGQHDEANECFQRYRLYDETANSYDSLGDGYFFAGELENCIQFKTSAIRAEEKNVPWAYMTLSDACALLARYKEADAYLQKYLEVVVQPGEDPSIYQAEVERKEAYLTYLQKEYDKAFELINHSLKLFDSSAINNDSAESHWLRGLILLKLKQAVAAQQELSWLEQFVNAHGLTATNFRAPLKYKLHLEALMSEQHSDIDKADQIYQQLLRMKPQLSYWITPFNFTFFQTEYAQFLMRYHRQEKAEKNLQICLDFDPNYPPALWLEYDLARHLSAPNQFDILNKIKEIYGPSEETNDLRDKLNKTLASTSPTETE